MEAITLPIYNSEGKEIDTIKLDSSVFDGVVNKAALHQVVCAYLACQRKGLAATKTRGEVSGGGVKPWRQKGTGRARVGSIRSPLWRHGGVVFGPHPRDFSYRTPEKLKKLALKSSLNAKVKENNFIVLDNFKMDIAKTKEAAQIFAHLEKGKCESTLFLIDKLNNNLQRALRNIDFLVLDLAKNAHAYEVLACKKLVATKGALAELVKRLKK